MGRKFSSKLLSFGFTLVELLIVIAVIAILASAVIIAINPAEKLSYGRDVQRKSDLEQIGSALNLYFADNNSFPASMQTLVSGNYIQKLPKDPTTNSDYIYAQDNSGASYRLYANFENCEDFQGETGVDCNRTGSNTGNYSVNSTNLAALTPIPVTPTPTSIPTITPTRAPTPTRTPTPTRSPTLTPTPTMPSCSSQNGNCEQDILGRCEDGETEIESGDCSSWPYACCLGSPIPSCASQNGTCRQEFLGFLGGCDDDEVETESSDCNSWSRVCCAGSATAPTLTLTPTPTSSVPTVSSCASQNGTCTWFGCDDDKQEVDSNDCTSWTKSCCVRKSISNITSTLTPSPTPKKTHHDR